MAVMNPLRVVITNMSSGQQENMTVKDLPGTESSHTINFNNVIFIDRSDFREVDDPDFFGLAPNKEVLLKYAKTFTCTEVIKNGAEVVEIRGTVAAVKKCKGTIQWVPSVNGKAPKPVEVRLYDHLFSVPSLDAPEVKDKSWKELLNPNSEIITKTCIVEESVTKAKPGEQFQFERVGYFIVDQDTTADNMVFNRTLTLRDGNVEKKGKDKKQADPAQAKAAKAALEAKQNTANIHPRDLFKSETNLYSKFDDDGIPTHDEKGEPLSKAKQKKLKTVQAKHKKVYDKQHGGDGGGKTEAKSNNKTPKATAEPPKAAESKSAEAPKAETAKPAVQPKKNSKKKGSSKKKKK